MGGTVLDPFTYAMSNTHNNQQQEFMDPGRLYHSAAPNWGPYNQQWKNLLGDSTALYNQQSAGVDPYLSQGWQNAYDTATDPSNMALLNNSRDYANTVLSGYFLNPDTNLALAQALQRGLENSRAFDSQAASAGRYGSGAWGQMKGRNLADLRGNLYGQGLNQMTNVAGMAPSIYGAQLLPAQTMMELGGQRENRGWNLLGKQANMLGATSSNNQPYYTQNPMMGTIGSVISAIGAVKGMGGGSSPGSDNGKPITQNTGGGATYNPYQYGNDYGLSSAGGGGYRWGR